MSRRDLTAVLAVLAVLAALPSAAREPEHPRNEKPAETKPVREGSDRDAKIRKAREEIRKNPAQKKFILFRYDLREEDL